MAIIKIPHKHKRYIFNFDIFKNEEKMQKINCFNAREFKIEGLFNVKTIIFRDLGKDKIHLLIDTKTGQDGIIISKRKLKKWFIQ